MSSGLNIKITITCNYLNKQLLWIIIRILPLDIFQHQCPNFALHIASISKVSMTFLLWNSRSYSKEKLLNNGIPPYTCIYLKKKKKKKKKKKERRRSIRQRKEIKSNLYRTQPPMFLLHLRQPHFHILSSHEKKINKCKCNHTYYWI